MFDYGSIWLKNDEAGYTTHLELLSDGWKSSISLGQCEPRHFPVVLVILLLSLVTGQENDLDDLLTLVDLLVQLGKDRGELATGRAVVHTEVDTNEFGALESFDWVHWACLGSHRGRSEKFLHHILCLAVFDF